MLENLVPPKREFACRVRTIANELDAKDKDILLNAVEDSVNWKIKTLEKELRKLGIRISDTPLITHRAKACGCYRDA